MKRPSTGSKRIILALAMVGVVTGFVLLSTVLATGSAGLPPVYADAPDESIEAESSLDESALLRQTLMDDLPDAESVSMPSPSRTLDAADRLERVYTTVGGKVYRSPFAPAAWSHIATDASKICQTYWHPHGSYLYALHALEDNCLPGKDHRLERSADWGSTWSTVTSIDKVSQLRNPPARSQHFVCRQRRRQVHARRLEKHRWWTNVDTNLGSVLHRNPVEIVLCPL